MNSAPKVPQTAQLIAFVLDLFFLECISSIPTYVREVGFFRLGVRKR